MNIFKYSLVLLCAASLQAGSSGSSFGAGFGGGLLGGMVGGALTQPRTTRTEVVQVPVQQPSRGDDDSGTVRKLRREIKALHDEIDDLTEEVRALRAENRRLKNEAPKKSMGRAIV